MKKLLQSLFVLMLFVSTAMAQTRTITGTVTDNTGVPIPNVSVKIKGAAGATLTKSNGSYTINVPSSATALEFSSLAFETKTVTISGGVVNVTLAEDSKNLNEVVVVGYGTVKKESLTGAVATVGAKNFESRPSTSFQKSLQGAAAGVQVTSVSGQPGGATTIRIRGEGSIAGGSSPLYVVDGIPISPSGNDLTSVAATADVLASLNPNDIESVTILKDASASAIYGSRAANGVVMVTTKQGKAGATRFNASVTSGFSDPAVDKHETLGAQQYYKLYFDSYYATALAVPGATPASAAASANTSTINRLAPLTGGYRPSNPFNSLAPFAADGSLAPGVSLIYDTDWRNEVMRRGHTKDVSVSASGGTEKMKFYVSGGYFDQKGIVIASDFKRFSGKVNLSNTVNDHLSFGINNTMSNSTQNTPPGAGGGANPVRFGDIAANIYSLYVRDASGTLVLDANGYPIYNYVNPVSPDFNPVGLSELDQYITKTTRLVSTPYAQLKFLKDFTFKSQVSLDYTAVRESQYYNPLHGNGVAVKGRGYRYAKEDITTTYVNTLNYDKAIGQHTLNVLLGQEAYKNKFDNFNSMSTNFAFPGQTELVASSLPGSVTSNYSEARFSSYFARLSYDFANKYYLSATFRRDGYSAFGPDNKYGNFPSVGVAWRVSQEKFMKSVSWLDELKLRASYGVLGNNSGIGRYQAQGLYGIGYSYEGNAGITYTQLAYPQLRWEKNIQTEIGLEFTLLNRRISGEVSYFNRASEDLLFGKPLSRITGFQTLTTNLADMDNKGVEFTLNGTAIRSTNFNWNVSFNLTSVSNKVKKLTQDEVVDGTKLLKVGQNRYQWYLREYAGIDPTDGRPQWYMDDANGNKVPTKAYASAKQYTGLGSSLPDFYGGLNNTMSYKEFDLSVFTYFSYGGKVYDNLYAALMHNGITVGQQMSVDVLNAWSPTNTSSTTPRFLPASNLDQSNSSSSRFLFDGSFIRVKNITLGYTLKKAWANKAKLSNVRLFVMAENPFTFAAHKGLDPEQSIAGTSDNDIPNIKTFSAGLTVGF